jgi:dephospho-CoA kinase
MKIVGLTGGIGSGKSTVARMLAARGARVIDADLLAREVVAPDLPAWQEIVEHFGEEVLNPDRTLNRERLAAVVFGDEDRRRLLNGIVHPRIGQETLERIKVFEREGAPLVVFDAALLLETPATNWIRPVIVVVADEETRVGRVVARDGTGAETARSRMAAQWTDAERVQHADYVIDNSGDLAALAAQVERLWGRLLAAADPRGIIK